MDEQILGIDTDLFITEIGLVVAGMAAIVGIWVERDRAKPMRYALWLSTLIFMATGVSMFQCFDDHFDQKKVEEDLARVLANLDKIAAESDVDIPALNDLIKTEIAAASRANPAVVEKVAQRVADEGGNPAEVMAAYLPESEVQDMQRKGRFSVKPTAAPVPKPEQAEAPAEGGEQAVAARSGSTEGKAVRRRRPLTFGGGPARILRGGEPAEAPKPAPPAPPTPEAAPAETAVAEAPAPAVSSVKAAEALAGPAAAGGKLRLVGAGAAPGGAKPPAGPTPPKSTSAPAAGPRLGGLKR
jgi:hypothetical protein